MNKPTRILKILSGILSFSLIIAVVLLQACKDDEDDTNTNGGNGGTTDDPLVGFYQFVSAEFNEEITIVVDTDTVDYVPGDDAAPYVQGGLFGSAPCQDPQNAALELRNNFEAYYACLNEPNELKMGTWDLSDTRTKLFLNISNPGPFQVIIDDVDLSQNILTGDITNLPVPKVDSIPVGQALPGGGLNLQLVNVHVVFNQE